MIWPEYLCCPPRVGDYVQSKDGPKLQISSITHSELVADCDNLRKPTLFIYLDKPDWQRVIEKNG